MIIIIIMHVIISVIVYVPFSLFASRKFAIQPIPVAVRLVCGQSLLGLRVHTVFLSQSVCKREQGEEIILCTSFLLNMECQVTFVQPCLWYQTDSNIHPVLVLVFQRPLRSLNLSMNAKTVCISKCNRTPVIRTLVIRIGLAVRANLSRILQNELASKLAVIGSSTVQCYGLQNFKSGVFKRFRRRCVL